MKPIFQSHHPVRHAKSFQYAFSGVWHALLNEANFRVQLAITAISIGFGIHFNITNMEWAVLTISMGMLLSAEMINTVVENFIDTLVKEYHEGAKIIKDVSAGFVLINAATTLIILILIFGHRLAYLFI